jgi:FkbM family methyltransferase
MTPGQFANAILAKCGFELRRRASPAPDRASHGEILRNAQRNGLDPNTIIDVGAAFGDFARAAAQVFPGRDVLLVEPLEEYGGSLKSLIAASGGRAVWVKGVAASEAGSATLNVHEDLVGSSVLQEVEHGVDGAPRTVPAIRLDDEVRSRGLRPPYLLKIDVQGSELAVLGGAPGIVEKTDFIVLEVSFFDFFRGGASVVDVIAYLAERDFVPYDLTSALYRPLDGALAQIDICFARKAGVLRRQHIYATPEQRLRQTEAMRAAVPRRR